MSAREKPMAWVPYCVDAPLELRFGLFGLRPPSDLRVGLVDFEVFASPEGSCYPWNPTSVILAHTLEGGNRLDGYPMLGVFCIQGPHEPRKTNLSWYRVVNGFR